MQIEYERISFTRGTIWNVVFNGISLAFKKWSNCIWISHFTDSCGQFRFEFKHHVENVISIDSAQTVPFENAITI